MFAPYERERNGVVDLAHFTEQLTEQSLSEAEIQEVLTALKERERLTNWPDLDYAVSQLTLEETWVKTVLFDLPPIMFVKKSRRIQLHSAIKVLESKIN